VWNVGGRKVVRGGWGREVFTDKMDLARRELREGEGGCKGHN